MAEDYYQILGLNRTAGQDEIKKTFKKLARKYHPDLNPGNKDSEKRFKQISEAYDVLSDTEKRKKYDQFGPGFANFSGGSQGAGQGGFHRGPFQSGFRYDSSGAENLDDILGDLFSGSGGMGGFGTSAGRRGGRRTMGHPGADIEASIELDFEEAALGCEKRISLSPSNTFTVRVPAGAKTGSRLRIPGKGQPGTGGFSPGDLYVIVSVRPHPYFKRDDNDIMLELPLSLAEALVGGKVKVPTLGGAVDVKVPKLASSGTRLRLKGKGIVDPKTKAAGDQYIVIKIELPQNLADDDLDKLSTILSAYPPPKRPWE